MKIFDSNELKNHIGSNTIYNRGNSYSSDHVIHNVQIKKGEDEEVNLIFVKATISGTYDYETEITFDSDDGEIIHSECDCPYWDTCKHISGLGKYIIRNHDSLLASLKKDLVDNSDIFAAFNKIQADKKITIDINQKVNQPSFSFKRQNQNQVALFFKTDFFDLENFLSSIKNTEQKIIWNIFFQEIGYVSGQKIFLNNEQVDKYFLFLLETKSLINKSEQVFKQQKEEKKMSFKVSVQEGFHISLSEGEILTGEKTAWYLEENNCWQISDKVPLPFLKQIENKKTWEVSPFEKKEIENLLIPYLKNLGHKVLLEGNNQDLEIIDKYEVHFYISERREKIKNQFILSQSEKKRVALEIKIRFISDQKPDQYYDFDFLKYIHELIGTGSWSSPYQFFLSKKYSHPDVIERNNNNYFSIDKNKFLQWSTEDFRNILSKIFWNNMYHEKSINQVIMSIESNDFINMFKKIEKEIKVNPNWHLHKDKNLENLSYRKRKVNFNFNFADLNHDTNLFDFDIEAQIGKQKITLKDLEAYLSSYDDFIDLDKGEFIEISNKEDIHKLLDFLEKTKANDKKNKKSFSGNFWQIPEIMNFIEKNKNISYQASEHFQNFLTEAKEGKPLGPINLASDTKKILRSYQIKGVEWGHFLRKYHFGGILADDMGTGKTLQTLALINSVKTKNPSLIVCPKTLIYNWEEEVKKFYPQSKVMKVAGNVAERAKQIKTKEIDKHDFIVTSYPLIQKDIKKYLELKNIFEYVVLDEAQHIKNHNTNTAKAVKLLPASHRLALTGTAIENGVSDLWSIFDFLMPQFLDNYKNFRNDFELPISKYSSKNALQSLSAKVKPFLLRRTKDTVLKDLPPKVEQNMFCELSKDQLSLYVHTLKQVKEEVLETVKNKGFDRSRIHILAALTKLRQICDHPRMIVPENKKAESGKMDLLMELLEEAFEGQHKVLIFSSFVKALKLIEEKLQSENIDYSYLDGQTQNRAKQIKSFNEEPNKKVFLISLKAGGTGLNLTSADTVILFDPWWNPMVEMQAMDRAHRIGQKKSVNVYSLLTKGTLEEKMLVIKEKKKQIFSSVIEENQDYLQKLEWQDIESLFEM